MIRLDEVLRSLIVEDVSQEEIINAIDGHNIVDIYYDEDLNPSPSDSWKKTPEPPVSNPKAHRVIEPYALGYTKAGNLVLRAYQPGGGTRKGAPKWKYFRVDRITSWKPRKQIFTSEPKEHGYGGAEDYNRDGDKLMTNVIAQVHFQDESDLDKIKNQTKYISNAPKLSTKNTSGPIPVYQQRKNNVLTTNPNSKKQQTYKQNFLNTQRSEEERKNYFDDYDKAWAEMEKNTSGPIKNDDYDEIDVDYNKDDWGK